MGRVPEAPERTRRLCRRVARSDSCGSTEENADGAKQAAPTAAGCSAQTATADRCASSKETADPRFHLRVFAAEGGLISYGYDQIVSWRGAATYVDRILRGEKPGELPVQAPTKFELVVNLKTARALGLSIPPAFPLRADEVIE